MAENSELKSNVLGNLLGGVKEKATSAVARAQGFTSQLTSASGGSSSSSLPGWLLPLALAGAAAFVVMKFIMPRAKTAFRGKRAPISFRKK